MDILKPAATPGHLSHLRAYPAWHQTTPSKPRPATDSKSKGSPPTAPSTPPNSETPMSNTSNMPKRQSRPSGSRRSVSQASKGPAHEPPPSATLTPSTAYTAGRDSADSSLEWLYGAKPQQAESLIPLGGSTTVCSCISLHRCVHHAVCLQPQAAAALLCHRTDTTVLRCWQAL